MRHHRRAPEQEASTGRHQRRARPRIAAAHAVGERARGLRQPEPAVLLLESRRQRRRRMVLGRGGERVEPIEGVEQHAGAEVGQPRADLTRGLLEADGRRLLEKDVARVHAWIHLERGDAGLGLAADDGPGDGRGPAIARQERGVDIDRAASGHVEHGLG